MTYTPKEYPGEGTILSYQAGATGSYIAVAQVTSIDNQEATVGAITTTTLADVIKKKRPSRQPDMGTVGFHINFDPNDTNTHITIRSRSQPQTGTPLLDGWKITYNDGDTTPATDAFTGFVSKWKGTGLEEDGNVGADIEITLTSIVTSTAGTP